MYFRFKATMFAGLLVGFIGCLLPFSDLSAQDKPVTYQIEPGKPHPDFILPGIQDGQPIQLSDFRGKKVLLVHFASW